MDALESTPTVSLFAFPKIRLVIYLHYSPTKTPGIFDLDNFLFLGSFKFKVPVETCLNDSLNPSRAESTLRAPTYICQPVVGNHYQYQGLALSQPQAR